MQWARIHTEDNLDYIARRSELIEFIVFSGTLLLKVLIAAVGEVAISLGNVSHISNAQRSPEDLRSESLQFVRCAAAKIKNILGPEHNPNDGLGSI
jgi:hypothetical protein